MTEDADASNNAALERLATGLALSQKPENSRMPPTKSGKTSQDFAPTRTQGVPCDLLVPTIHSVTSQQLVQNVLASGSREMPSGQ